MTLTVALVIYAAAMTLANLSVAAFGPSVTPINAFVLIGLDLALRDWLHVRLKVWQMGALIALTGVLTAAALVDWATFLRLKGSWLRRANGSNVAGAAVDSLLFPTIAFGALMPHIVLAQFVAKVAGGAFWAWLISRLGRQSLANER